MTGEERQRRGNTQNGLAVAFCSPAFLPRVPVAAAAANCAAPPAHPSLCALCMQPGEDLTRRLQDLLQHDLPAPPAPTLATVLAVLLIGAVSRVATTCRRQAENSFKYYFVLAVPGSIVIEQSVLYDRMHYCMYC